MPTDAALIGFTNQWQKESFPHAVERELPSGVRIRALPPPFLLATKIEAFSGRGEGDFLGSRDFADMVALVDGRAELLEEVKASPVELRAYLAEELSSLIIRERAVDGIYAQLLPDAASQERAETVVVPCLRELAATASKGDG